MDKYDFMNKACLTRDLRKQFCDLFHIVGPNAIALEKTYTYDFTHSVECWIEIGLTMLESSKGIP